MVPEQTYILGPGDITFIEFVGIPELSNNYIIDASGSFILPEIGYFNVEGKTIVETKSILLEEFSNYIFEPQMYICCSTKFQCFSKRGGK